MYYTDSDFPSLEVGYDELDAQIGAQIRQAQQYPSSDDNLPATFPDDLDHMFPVEPLRLPVPSTGQSHRNHPATSSSYPTDSPPSSSIAAHPLFPSPSSFVAPEGHADRYSSVTATSGEEPPVPFKLPYNPVDPSGSFTPRMSQNPFGDPFQNVGPYINPAALYRPSFAACFDEISRAQPQDVLSVDGICTLPAGSNDVPALGEPFPFPTNELHLERLPPANDNDTHCFVSPGFYFWEG
jgi:hypothetical protein